MSIIGTQMSSAVSFLTERLKIEQPASTDSALSSVAPNTDATTVDTEASYLLMLKDRIELGGYIYTSVSMKQQHMEELSGYLLQLRDVAIELQSYTQGTGEYDDAIARSQVIENDMSEFIGSVVHGQDLTPNAVFSKEQTMHSFLDFVDVNTGDENINQQVAAIEVDLISLFSNLHNPAVCVHCAEAAAANSQQTNSISGVLEPYASTAYNDSTAGAVAAPNTADATLEPLRMGEMWDVGDGDTLSYSYYEGAVAYDPNYNGNTGTPGTPSGIEAAGTGNSAALDEAFTAWDEAVAFDFEKVVESGTTVGELRVAFTDEGTTGGRAAFAYGPGSTYTINGQSYIDSFSTNGDIYFETADINTNGGAVDFDASGVGNTGFNFFTALHEIGHALGLSHPFDGGSDTGATLALSLDNMRQTVMTYVQTDRNVAFSINDNGNGTFSAATERIYSSTPGMLDFEMMGELYGTETDSSVTEGDNTYSFGANLQTIKTIADSGGTDTIDASAQTRNSTINLSAGAFSSIGIYTEA
ncbi:matrixin family metalloprotease [Alphaproteobacteria bacterium]|nr:matrixin family metalloprotease [Alphaproteobacteria bacterium]